MRTFDEDRDDHVPGKKSRIGDAVAVFTGPDLLAKLSKYDEDHVFHLSKRWRITIKGGQRLGSSSNPADVIQPTSNFAKKLMNDLSSEAAKEASANASPEDP